MDSLESKNISDIRRMVFELTLALYRVTDFFPREEALRRALREKANEIFARSSEYTYAENGCREKDAVSILSRIETLRGFLSVARPLGFVRPINISVLEREYSHLAQFFGREMERPEDSPKDREPAFIKEIPVVKEMPVIIKEPLEKFEVPVKAYAVSIESPVEGPGVMADNKPVDTQPVADFQHISQVMNQRQRSILEHIRNSSQAKISDFYTAFGDISSKTIQRDLQDLVNKNILRKEGEKRWTVYSMGNVR